MFNIASVLRILVSEPVPARLRRSSLSYDGGAGRPRRQR